MFKRLIASLVCITFSLSNLQYANAQPFSVNQLPVPGTMVGESAPFAPLALKGLVVNPQKPLEFQFIVDTGKGPQDAASVQDQANQLVKYFLAGLTIPEGNLWVNLSPYEKNRMVPQALGQTDLGRDLLAQDYILKQLTASLIYPEKDLGKEFWSRVYAKAQQQFGTTNVPVNTFNKVWILPDQAQVFENNNAAYVTKSTLKVMLDEDYLALRKGTDSNSAVRPILGQELVSVPNLAHTLASQIIRSIIIPEITKEVNTGKNFAPLRQIYQALILAKWYKETIQNGLLDAVYTNKSKLAGVNLNDPAVKEQIYNRYLQAYKKGAFNYIKEDPTPDGQVIPRKYFSGGTYFGDYEVRKDGAMSAITIGGQMISLTVALVAAGAALTFGRQVLTPRNQNPQTPDTAMAAKTGINPRFKIHRVTAQELNDLMDRFPGQLEGHSLVITGKTMVPEMTVKNVTPDQLKYLMDTFGERLEALSLKFDIGPKPSDAAMASSKVEKLNKSILGRYMLKRESFSDGIIIKKKNKDIYMLYRQEIYWYGPRYRYRPDSRLTMNISSGAWEMKYSYWERGFENVYIFSWNGTNSFEVSYNMPWTGMGSIIIPVTNDPLIHLERTKPGFDYLDMITLVPEAIKGLENNLIGGRVALELLNVATSKFKIIGAQTSVKAGESVLQPGQKLEVDRDAAMHVGGLEESQRTEVERITELLNSIRPAGLQDYLKLHNLKLTTKWGLERFFTAAEGKNPQVVDYILNDGKFVIGYPNDYSKVDQFFIVPNGNGHILDDGTRILINVKLSLPRKDHDAAMTKNLGGIDLNQINVKRTGKTINVQFDPAQLSQLEQGGFEGFTPVIISMTPISSPFQLLGIDQTKANELLAKA